MLVTAVEGGDTRFYGVTSTSVYCSHCADSSADPQKPASLVMENRKDGGCPSTPGGPVSISPTHKDHTRQNTPSTLEA